PSARTRRLGCLCASRRRKGSQVFRRSHGAGYQAYVYDYTRRAQPRWSGYIPEIGVRQVVCAL
ncbi:hypothetical protein LTR33_015315, partial [Friedmanniomyces endolithicus]